MASNDDEDNPFWDRRHNYDVNSKIMLVAIVSLSFVVILVTILHLYARCVLRRQARRQDALRRLGIITASATVHTAEPPKTGLDPSVIAALPIFMFKNTAAVGNDGGSAAECAVCLSSIEDGEMARTLPNCKHTFHANCIDQWLGSNSTCPICRTGAEPRLVAEPREGIAIPAAAAAPTAPPLEGTSEGKGGGSTSRLSSFRRILSREKSSRRMQVPDLERQ